jgi:hypothetical protein
VAAGETKGNRELSTRQGRAQIPPQRRVRPCPDPAPRVPVGAAALVKQGIAVVGGDP